MNCINCHAPSPKMIVHAHNTTPIFNCQCTTHGLMHATVVRMPYRVGGHPTCQAHKQTSMGEHGQVWTTGINKHGQCEQVSVDKDGQAGTLTDQCCQPLQQSRSTYM